VPEADAAVPEADAKPDTVAWLDAIPAEQAVGMCGAKMGRLTELLRSGVSLPHGFTVTVEAYRQHCDRTGLDQVIDAALGGLGADAGPAEVEIAAQTVRSELAARPMDRDLAGLIVDAYEELSSRCFDINVPTAVRSSAIGEDSHAASFAGIFETYLGVSGPDRVLEAVRDCWASLFSPRAVAYRLRAGLRHQDMPMAVGVVELIHARASGVAFSAHPVTGKTDRVVIETSWGWGEAVVQGLVTPDHIEVGKADGRVLRYQVAAKKVVSSFDYAAGRVVETAMPARLVDRRVLDEEQIAAVVGTVLAVERHYGYPVDVEWVLDKYRRAGEPVCVVQARPVTASQPEVSLPASWNPAAMAAKHVFGR
jgi:pyruvate, water dikinase